MVTQASDVEKIIRIEGEFRELRDNLEKGVSLRVGMTVKDIAGNLEARAMDAILKGEYMLPKEPIESEKWAEYRATKRTNV